MVNFQDLDKVDSGKIIIFVNFFFLFVRCYYFAAVLVLLRQSALYSQNGFFGFSYTFKNSFLRERQNWWGPFKWILFFFYHLLDISSLVSAEYCQLLHLRITLKTSAAFDHHDRIQQRQFQYTITLRFFKKMHYFHFVIFQLSQTAQIYKKTKKW